MALLAVFNVLFTEWVYLLVASNLSARRTIVRSMAMRVI
ncbi:hypothetical protein VCHA29O37_140093 [Vibrio chagasii]|nr:hypothetical protein VCHA29O37_140093 [Vibrio chagasii]